VTAAVLPSSSAARAALGRWRVSVGEQRHADPLTSSDVFGGLASEDGFNAESGFPRRQNAVTRTLRWSDVRMPQPGSATFRVLAGGNHETLYGGSI
jgi:hypothetical protein